MKEHLDDMYRDVILDHYRAPRGKNPLPRVDIRSDGANPACGDELEMQVQVEGEILKDIHVGCKGCAISVASGSMLAEAVKGKSISEAKRIAELVRKLLKGEPTEIPDDLGDIDALRGVQNFPVRIKCALLAWVTLIHGLDQYQAGTASGKKASTEE